MSGPYLLWKMAPQETQSRWILISDEGRTRLWPNVEECMKWLQTQCEGVFYTNSDHVKPEDNVVIIHKLDLTPFEYHYLFNLIEAWVPDFDDPSSVLSQDKTLRTEKKLKPLIEWVVRFHQHFNRINEALLPFSQNKSTPAGSYQKVANWLSRRYSRLYPEGTILDKHVYCARWVSSHWAERLHSGFAKTPRRDAGMLKACRVDPNRAKLIDQAAFMLVNIAKTTVPIDFPCKQLVWISNAELNAITQADPKTKYQVEDLLTFPVENVPEELALSDNSMLLSISHGIALRQSLSCFEGTWEMAWWRSLERAKWIALIAEASKSHEMIVSGYGDGYLSFYCWAGEMAKLTELLKMKASVLKHSDQDYDVEFQQELRTLLTKEYIDAPNEQLENEMESIQYDTTNSTTTTI